MSKNVVKNRIFGNELKYLKQVLKTEFRTSSGSKMVSKFEKQFAKKFNSQYAIAFTNGTATMHAALEALGVRAGDEVIVPPLTMSATSFAVLQANATPVFADIEPDTFQISAQSIMKCITSKTKGIITVALYGMCPDMDKILKISKKYNLFILEDNAECFLGKYKNKTVGTIGDCASFSFQSSKHLTSGEGGVIITSNKNLASKIRRIQSLGYAGVSFNKSKITKKDIQDPNYSRHIVLGWNYRMPELCAAVALGQLENINTLVNKRIEVAKIYEKAVKDFFWFKPQFVGKDYVHTYWTWAAYLERKDISWYEFRDRFISNGGDGIYSAWKLTYLEPMFQRLNLLGREKFINLKNIKKYKKKGICPVAEKICKRLFQFKTNYWDLNHAKKQAEILKLTLKSFEK